MKPMSQQNWDSLVNQTVANLTTPYGIERLNFVAKQTNFFENWLVLEMGLAAKRLFNVSPAINSDDANTKVKKVDFALDVNGELLCVEWKHIPTLSSNACSRLFGPKDSRVTRDWKKLYTALQKPPNQFLAKVAVLYGPVSSTDKTGRTPKSLRYKPLSVMLQELEKAIKEEASLRKFTLKRKVVPLGTTEMNLIILDVK